MVTAALGQRLEKPARLLDAVPERGQDVVPDEVDVTRVVREMFRRGGTCNRLHARFLRLVYGRPMPFATLGLPPPVLKGFAPPATPIQRPSSAGPFRSCCPART